MAMVQSSRINPCPVAAPSLLDVEVVAHRAGNTVEAARQALGQVDRIELDVHVLRGDVEVRHAKVLHPTKRLWEKWYLLPRGSRGVPIGDVLAELGSDTPLMIDLKCFTRRSVSLIRRALPEGQQLVVSTRSWWTLAPFADRPNTTLLRSCGTAWQLWWALNRAAFGQGRGVSVHESRLTESVIDRLRERTDVIYTWGATTPARCQELIEAGVTGVILDDYSIAARSDRQEGHPDG